MVFDAQIADSIEIMPRYRPRLLDPLIAEVLDELPALLLVGPRATGKTTTAARHAKTVVRLDREAEAVAFRADPDAALRDLPEPVLLDEWQEVPEVLAAVKRAIDQDSRPGRFLLTGSVRNDLEAETWPGTGRLVRLRFLGMTVREQRARTSGFVPFLDRIQEGDTIDVSAGAPDLRGYVEHALAGGFPQAAFLSSTRARQLWIDSYVDQLVTRDAALINGGRDPERLRRYFEGYAINSAGVVAEKTLLETAQINRKTADAYEQLLKNLFVIESLPAWSSNRIKRLVKSPKRLLVDASFLTALLRLDAQAVMRDGNLLGRLLETFVISQLRAELDLCRSRPRLYHLRNDDGRHEVDIIAELGAGRVIGIEVKATAAPSAEHAKHLEWLKASLGDRFVMGLVLHTGPRVFELADRIVAVPICALWT